VRQGHARYLFRPLPGTIQVAMSSKCANTRVISRNHEMSNPAEGFTQYFRAQRSASFNPYGREECLLSYLLL